MTEYLFPGSLIENPESAIIGACCVEIGSFWEYRQSPGFVGPLFVGGVMSSHQLPGEGKGGVGIDTSVDFKFIDF